MIQLVFHRRRERIIDESANLVCPNATDPATKICVMTGYELRCLKLFWAMAIANAEVGFALLAAPQNARLMQMEDLGASCTVSCNSVNYICWRISLKCTAICLT